MEFPRLVGEIFSATNQSVTCESHNRTSQSIPLALE